MPPARPNAHPGGTTSPIPNPFAPPYPEKTVTFLRHSFPGAAPSNPTHVPPLPHVCAISPHQSAPIPRFSPPLLKYTHIRATLAHARDRPRGPEILPPSEVGPQASCRSVETGHRPLSYYATRRDISVPMCTLRHYRIAHDRRHSQLEVAQNVAERDRFPAFAEMTVLGGAQQFETGSLEGCALTLPQAVSYHR